MEVLRKHNIVGPLAIIATAVAFGVIGVKSHQYSKMLASKLFVGPYGEIIRELNAYEQSFGPIENHIENVKRRLKMLGVEMEQKDMQYVASQYALLTGDQLDILLSGCKSDLEILREQAAEKSVSLETLRNDVQKLVQAINSLKGLAKDSSLATATMERAKHNGQAVEREAQRTRWEAEELV